MSTILDALRKAKEAPEPEKPVDARKEILSQSSHNYLAQTPVKDPFSKVPFLIGFIFLCVLVISGLLIFILWLMLGQDDADVAEASQAESAIVEMEPEPVVVREVLRVPVTEAKPAPAIELPGRDFAGVVAPPTTQAPPAPQVVPAQQVAPVPTRPIPPIVMTEPEVRIAPSLPVAVRSSSDELYRATVNKLYDLEVSGIFWDEHNPVAMLGGKTIKVGSHVGAAKVSAINRNSIVFEIDGQKFILRQ